jgi:hypothetical protein
VSDSAEGKSDRTIDAILSIKPAFFLNFHLVGSGGVQGAVARYPSFGCTPAYVYRALVEELALKVYI